MKRFSLVLIMVVSVASLFAQFKMNITINGKTMAATMVDNSSAVALKALLEQGGITYEAHDYGGFEKVGNIGHALPQNNESINTQPGDIILYQGNSICLYYGNNSWSFTRLGKIDFTDESELRDFLDAGGESVNVRLSLVSSTAVFPVEVDEKVEDAVYDLNGRKLSDVSQAKGVYISNGKKYIKR